MGSPGHLALGCRPGSPTTVGNIFKAAPSGGAKVHRLHVLDQYLKALEDERRKIEAFKRELPHCMQLLDYAIDASKENLVTSSSTCSPNQPISTTVGKTTETLGLFGKQMVQEFLKTRREPRKDEDSDEYEKEKARKSSSSADGDYPTWMAEAQLWRDPSRSDLWREKESSTDDSVGLKKESAEKSTVTSPALLFNGKQRPGGAFMPFVKEKPVPVPVVRAKAGVSDLVLSSGDSRRTSTPGFGATDKDVVGRVEISAKAMEVSTCISQGKDAAVRSNGGGSTYSGCTESTTSGGSQRKARRCWSPELHRRFVSALQQLGGSQIATPKQIRELMKVDGLTNDEVKSHLQKYRLHTRRPSPTPQASPQATPAQLVVLGGLWVPPEYGNATIYHDPSASVSQPEPIFCQPYSQLRPSVQIELHRSQSECSPQGPLQSTSNISSGARQISGEGCRDESIGEDGKSESSSWKGENNSRESSAEKESSIERKYENDSKGDRRNDTDDNEITTRYDDTDGGVRLQLEMSCSSAQRNIKPEPQSA